ncbi:MAG: beta-galactosidase [Chloroflexota bacterium]
MFYFGVDYYPEQWPEARWPEDARLMAEAGFNVARLAEFAWARLEPREGQVDFSWLDRAIDHLSAHGIQIVLGTPTASPPPWLMATSTDLFLVGEDGRRATFGNRREYCPNQPAYHDHTRRIVAHMAEHYADHPAVIGWQIDNEFGQRCYCRTCAERFREWLQDRYRSLDVLNERWGTAFWSHVYTAWDQIPLPLASGRAPNPGLALDFYRFASDSYVAYQQIQVNLLRERCPDHFITHNFMGLGYDRIDYFDLARALDFVSWDNYPRGYWALEPTVDPWVPALSADTMRGLKRRNVWVMEQQAGPSGWETVGVAPRPGELRLWAYQAIAHGADAIVFFRWRTARFGTEQYWHGVLDHHGVPGRRYDEIVRMGMEIARSGEQLAGSQVRSSVALLLSYDSRFAFQIQGTNPGFSYSRHFYHLYRAFRNRHVSIDVVAPGDDVSHYDLVVAPALHVLSQATAESLKTFVEGGGTLVVTARSGVKDEANAVVNEPLPGLLAALCGVEVEEYDSLPRDAQEGLAFVKAAGSLPASAHASVWSDVLKTHGADVVARYSEGYYAGRPAISMNQVGRGRAVYVGTLGDASLYEALAPWLLELAEVEPILSAPPGVEVAERWRGDQRLLFLLNHTSEEQEVALDTAGVDLLAGGSIIEGPVVVPPRDVLVLLEQ